MIPGGRDKRGAGVPTRAAMPATGVTLIGMPVPRPGTDRFTGAGRRGAIAAAALSRARQLDRHEREACHPAVAPPRRASRRRSCGGRCGRRADGGGIFIFGGAAATAMVLVTCFAFSQRAGTEPRAPLVSTQEQPSPSVAPITPVVSPSQPIVAPMAGQRAPRHHGGAHAGAAPGSCQRSAQRQGGADRVPLAAGGAPQARAHGPPGEGVDPGVGRSLHRVAEPSAARAHSPASSHLRSVLRIDLQLLGGAAAGGRPVWPTAHAA